MKTKKEKMKRQTKQGISLIALVITITSRYDKWLKASKIGKVPPKNKIEITRKLINIGKVVDFKSATFLFQVNMI